MLTARPQLSLKGRALRFLSQREHSRSELERKLAKHEEEPGQLRRILDDLQARGFIDHERVAESVLNRRAGKLGAMRIRQELRGKGIEPELVAQAVAQLNGSELERAREVWRRKFDAPPQNEHEHARQARFLAARGFGMQTISRVLRETLAGG
jgi:regulatory protein